MCIWWWIGENCKGRAGDRGGPHGDLKDVDRGVQPGVERGYIELAQQREGKDRERVSGSRVTMRIICSSRRQSPPTRAIRIIMATVAGDHQGPKPGEPIRLCQTASAT